MEEPAGAAADVDVEAPDDAPGETPDAEATEPEA